MTRRAALLSASAEETTLEPDARRTFRGGAAPPPPFTPAFALTAAAPITLRAAADGWGLPLPRTTSAPPNAALATEPYSNEARRGFTPAFAVGADEVL